MCDRFEILSEIYKWEDELEKLDEDEDIEEIKEIENRIRELNTILEEAE